MAITRSQNTAGGCSNNTVDQQTTATDGRGRGDGGHGVNNNNNGSPVQSTAAPARPTPHTPGPLAAVAATPAATTRVQLPLGQGQEQQVQPQSLATIKNVLSVATHLGADEIPLSIKFLNDWKQELKACGNNTKLMDLVKHRKSTAAIWEEWEPNRPPDKIPDLTPWEESRQVSVLIHGFIDLKTYEPKCYKLTLPAAKDYSPDVLTAIELLRLRNSRFYAEILSGNVKSNGIGLIRDIMMNLEILPGRRSLIQKTKSERTAKEIFSVLDKCRFTLHEYFRLLNNKAKIKVSIKQQGEIHMAIVVMHEQHEKIAEEEKTSTVLYSLERSKRVPMDIHQDARKELKSKADQQERERVIARGVQDKTKQAHAIREKIKSDGLGEVQDEDAIAARARAVTRVRMIPNNQGQEHDQDQQEGERPCFGDGTKTTGEEETHGGGFDDDNGGFTFPDEDSTGDGVEIEEENNGTGGDEGGRSLGDNFDENNGDDNGTVSNGLTVGSTIGVNGTSDNKRTSDDNSTMSREVEGQEDVQLSSNQLQQTLQQRPTGSEHGEEGSILSTRTETTDGLSGYFAPISPNFEARANKYLTGKNEGDVSSHGSRVEESVAAVPVHAARPPSATVGGNLQQQQQSNQPHGVRPAPWAPVQETNEERTNASRGAGDEASSDASTLRGTAFVSPASSRNQGATPRWNNQTAQTNASDGTIDMQFTPSPPGAQGKSVEANATPSPPGAQGKSVEANVNPSTPSPPRAQGKSVEANVNPSPPGALGKSVHDDTTREYHAPPASVQLEDSGPVSPITFCSSQPDAEGEPTLAGEASNDGPTQVEEGEAVQKQEANSKGNNGSCFQPSGGNARGPPRKFGNDGATRMGHLGPVCHAPPSQLKKGKGTEAKDCLSPPSHIKHLVGTPQPQGHGRGNKEASPRKDVDLESPPDAKGALDPALQQPLQNHGGGFELKYGGPEELLVGSQQFQVPRRRRNHRGPKKWGTVSPVSRAAAKKDCASKLWRIFSCCCKLSCCLLLSIFFFFWVMWMMGKVWLGPSWD